MQMPENESNLFIAVPAAGRIVSSNRGIYRDDVRGRQPVRFKPYSLLTARDLHDVGLRIQARTRRPDSATGSS